MPSFHIYVETQVGVRVVWADTSINCCYIICMTIFSLSCRQNQQKLESNQWL